MLTRTQSENDDSKKAEIESTWRNLNEALEIKPKKRKPKSKELICNTVLQENKKSKIEEQAVPAQTIVSPLIITDENTPLKSPLIDHFVFANQHQSFFYNLLQKFEKTQIIGNRGVDINEFSKLIAEKKHFLQQAKEISHKRNDNELSVTELDAEQVPLSRPRI